MAEKRIEYIGKGRPGVVFQDGNGRTVRADYGEPIEVDAEVAKGLLSQPTNWREVKPGPKPQPATQDKE
jgi:hypothetical protein